MAQSKLSLIIETLYQGKGVKDATQDLKELDGATEQGTSRMDQFRSAMTSVAAVAGTAGAALYAAKKAFDFGAEGQKLLNLEMSFRNLSLSAGESADVIINKMRMATNGMVADSELMLSTNRFLAMGLADTGSEAAKLAEIAVTLGTAFGRDASASMEEFALLLANQSIPRLDTFGISAAKVRQRIEELQAATPELTRETAFMQAVMEEAAVSMSKLGDSMPVDEFARAEAQFQNLTEESKKLAAQLGSPTAGMLAGIISTKTGVIELHGALKDSEVSFLNQILILKRFEDANWEAEKRMRYFAIAIDLAKSGIDATAKEFMEYIPAIDAANMRAEAANEYYLRMAEALNMTAIAANQLKDPVGEASIGIGAMGESARETYAQIYQLNRELAALDGTNVNASVSVDVGAALADIAHLRNEMASLGGGLVGATLAGGGSSGPAIPAGGGGGGGSSPPGPPEFQHGTGGWQIVPPGYESRPYLVGLHSGEPFNVIPKSQASGASLAGGITVQIYPTGGQLNNPGVMGKMIADATLNNLAGRM